MKKYYFLIIVALILGLILTGCSLLSNVGQVPVTSQTKVKPGGNQAGALEVAWNLSADVMPVPKYGSRDIPGSDTASKLIVNQPNGAVEVTITGVMNGLNPNTEYTVYLSNAYTPYVDTGWNVSGNYVIDLECSGTHYSEDLVLVQSGIDITGQYLALVGGGSVWTIYEGSVVGSAIEFKAFFGSLTTRTALFLGTIAPDGTISGTWADDFPYLRSGTWESTTGAAAKTHTGNTGWSGLFTSTIQPFTFTTDEYGSKSWHLNLRDEDFNGPNIYHLSVWINVAGGTMLISDAFDVIVD